MNKDNRGVTLIELIVVIAVMAILIGLAVLSVEVLFGTQAKACAQNVSAMLDETKAGGSSRFDETMTLVAESDGYYSLNQIYTIDQNAQPILIKSSTEAGEEKLHEKRKVGSRKVTVSVYFQGEAEPFVIDENKSVTIRFDRATGAYKPVEVKEEETVLNKKAQKMTFSAGLRTYVITMIPETGKHAMSLENNNDAEG